MNSIKKLAVWLFAISALIVAACGGGEDELSATGQAHLFKTGSSDAQGVYEGLVANQIPFRAIVLDNDEYYLLYGDVSGDGFYVSGFLQGNGRSGNGSFTSSDMKDFYFGGLHGGSFISGSLNASYVPAMSFSGTTTEDSKTVAFASSAISTEIYDYNTPAELSNIATAWKMDDVSGNSLQLSIGKDGKFSGSYAGCGFNGTMSPRASGKNVFDMQLKFGPSPCSQPNQSATGITLVTDTLETQQLITVGLDDSRNKGLFFIAFRDDESGHSTIIATQGVEPIRSAVGSPLSIPIYFNSMDGNVFNLVISNFLSLPAGWSSPDSYFYCTTVTPTGGACTLELTFKPTTVTPESRFSLPYSYTDDRGVNRSGTMEIVYSTY